MTPCFLFPVRFVFAIAWICSLLVYFYTTCTLPTFPVVKGLPTKEMFTPTLLV